MMGGAPAISAVCSLGHLGGDFGHTSGELAIEIDHASHTGSILSGANL
jgi:hypothetical protein